MNQSSKDLDEIIQCIKNLESIQQVVVDDLKIKINNIIKNNITDDKMVEHIYDNLINLLQTKEVEKLFKKLSKYYYFVNPNLVCEYVNLYRELYIDDFDYPKTLNKI